MLTGTKILMYKDLGNSVYSKGFFPLIPKLISGLSQFQTFNAFWSSRTNPSQGGSRPLQLETIVKINLITS